MKKVLLWFLLILLFLFLLLPPGLRIFATELYKEEEQEQKDVVTVLNCTKNEDVISTTYLNDNPYDFKYAAKGNYNETSQDGTDESEEDTNTNTNIDNSIVYDIRDSSMVSYNESDNITNFHILISSVELINDKLANYTKKPDEQQKYYTALGFSCTITTV